MVFKVLVSDKLADKAIEVFKSDPGFEVVVKTGLSEDELVREIPSYDALVVRSGTKVTRKIIEAAENLKVIGRAGVGVDNIDCEAAKERGIPVMNVPLGNINSAAEHTIALMLALARNIPQAHMSMLKGEWDRKRFVGVEVKGKTLGIIGVGNVGSIVARIAGKGLLMNVIGYDKFKTEEQLAELGIKKVSLEELCKTSDFIVMSLKLVPETRNTLDEEHFKMMKPSVRIINAARGGLINEKALAEALKSGKVAGAAIDVWEKEPPVDSPLVGLENVVMTPHLGASTKEAQINVGVDIAKQIIKALKEDKIVNCVNGVTTIRH